MKRLRVYMDTSVFGGYFDEEFEAGSRSLFDAIWRGKITPLVSETVARELADAPEQVRELFQRTLAGDCERIEVIPESIGLAQAYVQAGVVTEKYADDALHVASATLARADVIVSWNFRHLVNPARIRGFNGVNVAQGQSQVIILTPEDVANSLEERHEDQGQDL